MGKPIDSRALAILKKLNLDQKDSQGQYKALWDCHGTWVMYHRYIEQAGAETIRVKVYDVICNKGNFGATSDEVAELLNLSPFTVRPRVTELYKQGKIERTDKRKNLCGAMAYVYKVSKQEINKLYTERGI